MSGVYGLISPKKDIANENLNKLSAWNSIYGHSADQCIKTSEYIMGCFYNSDLDPECTTPCPVISSGDKLAVIDAVIYNRDELINELSCHNVQPSGHPIADNILLFNYINMFGYDALKGVNGDFSGAILSVDDKQIVLFRDHLGVRPLFYAIKDGSLAFSTDIRGIASLDCLDISLSDFWLYKILSGKNQLSLTDTEYENVFCVTPGSYLTVNNLFSSEIQISKKCYWTLSRKKIKYKSEKEYISSFKSLVEDSINRRLSVCKKPVGAELSGGLDSSVISILVSKSRQDSFFYSWSPSKESLPYVKNDERIIIDEICNQHKIVCNYGTTNYNIGRNSDIFKETQRILNKNFDIYRGWEDYLLPPYANTFTIMDTSQFMREHNVKIVFTGHGGDEGVSHRSSPYELFYNHEYIHFLKCIWCSAGGKGLKRFAKFIINSIKCVDNGKKLNSTSNTSIVSDASIVNKDLISKYKNKPIPPFYFAYSPIEYVNNGGIRPRLDLIAMYSAYSNVRYVVPYLDYRLLEFAVSIPRCLYLKGSKNRYIFREAFKDILPNSLYKLRRKETASTSSIPREKPNYTKIITEAVKNLDANIWGKYIDFEALSRLAATSTDESPDKEQLRKNVVSVLSIIISAQNTLDRLHL